MICQVYFLFILLKIFIRNKKWENFIKTLTFLEKSMYKLNRHLLHKDPPNQSLLSIDWTKIFDQEHKTNILLPLWKLQLTNDSG